MGFGKKFKKVFHAVNSAINPLYGATIGVSELTGARKKVSHQLRKVLRKGRNKILGSAPGNTYDNAFSSPSDRTIASLTTHRR